MIFTELEVKNFRSINGEGLKITFTESNNIYSLVGANNSGKTNILDALALVLGIRSGKFYNYNISISDFYNQDINERIVIKITLRTPLKYRNVYQQECSIKGFIYEAKLYVTGESKGQIHSEHYCFGTNAKGHEESPLLDSDKMYKPKKGTTDEDIENRKKPILAKEHLYKLGSVYFLDIAYLSSFFRVSGYNPLGRLLQVYKDDFQTGKSIYKYQENGQEKETNSINAYINKAAELTEILKTDKLIDIEQNLSKNISEYLGLEKDQKTSISLGLPNHEEILEDLIRLKIKENPALTSLEISNIGSGYLSLVRLAVLRTLLEMTQKESVLYIIEEPEIYLHAHLRRFLYKTLKLLSQKGSQVIFSTHSQEFVDLRDYSSIIRLQKKNALSSNCFQVSGDLTLDFNKIHQKVSRKGNEDIFFAQHVLLTEGQDDQIIFTEILNKKIDCDAKSISIIDCDGKSQMPDYIRLCQSLNIDCFAIFDTDKNNAKSSKEGDSIRSVLNSDISKYSALPDTLEAALKTQKQNDNWKRLLSLVEGLDYDSVRNQYPDCINAIEPFIDRFNT